MLSTRQVVNALKEQGHKIEYRERTDGGIFITKIDGKKYSRSEGNKVGRALANAPISERKSSQLKYATRQQKARTKAGYTPKAQRPPKGTRRRRTDSELTQEELLKRQIKRTQTAWRKSKAKGIITTKKVRYNIEKEGVEATLGKLRRMELYAKGYAYSENVEALIERIESLKNHAEGEDKENLQKILEKIISKKDTFKETWLQDILQMAYDYENDLLKSADFLTAVEKLVK